MSVQAKKRGMSCIRLPHLTDLRCGASAGMLEQLTGTAEARLHIRYRNNEQTDVHPRTCAGIQLEGSHPEHRLHDALRLVALCFNSNTPQEHPVHNI